MKRWKGYFSKFEFLVLRRSTFIKLTFFLLDRYSPLLPLSPMFVESYSENVESPSIITSTSANLESQTLILALGGPDIFFTRFAPSKGFDSLPESFNKLSIVIVLIVLYMVIQTLKSMSEKKFVIQFWS